MIRIRFGFFYVFLPDRRIPQQSVRAIQYLVWYSGHHFFENNQITILFCN